jgi:asparagine synthase (glutamine-hydrolysing)
MAKIFGIIKQGNSGKILPKLKEMGNSFKFGKCTYKTFKNGGFGHLFNDNINKEQPITDSKAGLSIVFCGKIFDYEKEKQILIEQGFKFNYTENDAEFILCSYQADGLKFLHKLNGVFCFAIWDEKRKKLILANDRCGISPMYYYHDKDKFIFGSEVKALLAANEIIKEINWEGWRDFFAFEYLLGTKTHFKNVYSLPNGSYIIVDKKGMKIENYWDYDRIKVDYSQPFEYFVEKGVEVIRNAILRQTKGMKKAVVFLSGGYDSRCIAASLKKYTNVQFETYTTIHPTGLRDAKLGQEVAKKLGVSNHFIPPPNNKYAKYFPEHIRQTDGLSSINFWLMPLLDNVETNNIVFDGLMGDALLSGSRLQRDMCNYGWNDRMDDVKTATLLFETISDFPDYPKGSPYKFFKPTYLKKIKPDKVSIQDALRKTIKNEYRITAFQLKNRTKNTIALDTQNLTLRKLRCYYPFLDKDIVEFALTIPPEFKFKRNIYNKILQKAFPDVMIVPSSRDLTPRKFAGRIISGLKNHSLVRLARKAEKSMRANKKIAAQKLPDIDYLSKISKEMPMSSFIERKKLLREIETCTAKNRDPINSISALLRFCVWYNIYIEN